MAKWKGVCIKWGGEGVGGGGDLGLTLEKVMPMTKEKKKKRSLSHGCSTRHRVLWG